MTLRIENLLRRYDGRVFMRLAAGAIGSSSLSMLLAVFSGKLFGQTAFHLFFIAASGKSGCSWEARGLRYDGWTPVLFLCSSSLNR